MFRSITFFLLVFNFIVAQNTITGKVIDSDSGEPIYLANVVVSGKLIGGATNFDGVFSINSNDLNGIILEIHSVGYKMKKVNVTNSDVGVIKLDKTIYGETVVVTASRQSESILESAATIAKLDAIDIKNVPAASFYDGISNMPSIDMVQASIGMKTVNMRGFNSTTPDRVVQFIDGMDNQAPALNFSVSNLVGISELDIENVEVIYGAASSSYGPNAFNGVISLNSKSPWDYPGLSLKLSGGERTYQQAMARYAQVVSDKFAYKVNFSYMNADEWRTNNEYVSLKEHELTDNEAKNIKMNTSLHYRINSSTELSYLFNRGKGSTIYQGSERYNIKNFTLTQHKIELNGILNNSSYKFKAYKTIDDSGDTYNIGLTAQYLLSAPWKGIDIEGNPIGIFSSKDPMFKDVFKGITSRAAGIGKSGLPGSAVFDESTLTHFEGQYTSSVFGLNSVLGASYRIYDPETNGTLFRDSGTQFDEDLGDITVSEVGTYLQLKRDLLNKRLNVTLTGRYDKHENFDAQFSPGVQLVYSLKQDSEHSNNGNIRFSYQTAFRNPSIEDQYIGLNGGSAKFMSDRLSELNPGVRGILYGNHGGYLNPNAITENDFNKYVAYMKANATNIQNDITDILGSLGRIPTQEDIDNATAQVSGQYAGQFIATNPVTTANIEAVKPEQVTSWEFGYKTIINKKLFVDMNYYQQEYTDFIKEKNFFVMRSDGNLVPDLLTQNFDLYIVDSNSDEKVKTHGYSLALNYNLNEHFMINGNYSTAKILSGKDLGFNTPKHKFNLGFSGRNINNFGFNVNFKHVDSFYWKASGFEGQVPQYNIVDLSILYDINLDNQNVNLKLTVSNMFDKKYNQAYGTPIVGRLALLQLTTEL